MIGFVFPLFPSDILLQLSDLFAVPLRLSQILFGACPSGHSAGLFEAFAGAATVPLSYIVRGLGARSTRSGER